MAIDRLVFVGTVHVHPRGPELLESLLDEIRSRNGAPAFVAVEANEESVARAGALAGAFESALATRGFAPGVAEALARVPLYEGSTVSRFCGEHVPVVWLTDAGEVAGWEGRLAGILDRFGHEPQLGVLRSWSEGAFEACAYENFDDEARSREASLFERLNVGLAQHSSSAATYAMIVVGANHASRAKDRLCGMCLHQLDLDISRVWCTERWPWGIDDWLGLQA